GSRNSSRNRRRWLPRAGRRRQVRGGHQRQRPAAATPNGDSADQGLDPLSDAKVTTPHHSRRRLLQQNLPIPDSCTATKTLSFEPRRKPVIWAIEEGRYAALGRPIQPPTLLRPKLLDLRLEHGFNRSVRRLNGNYSRPSIGDTASLADAIDLRTLLR